MLNRVRNKNHLNQIKTLTFVVASKHWNSVIEDTFLKSKSLGIKLVWIKHLSSSDGTTTFNVSTQSKDLMILECYNSDDYIEKFLFKSLSFLNLSTWYFLIASDEFISTESMSKLNDLSSSLDEKYVYRCNRLWIKLVNQDFFYSALTTAVGSSYDYQYRLFNLKYLKPDERIHTPGFYVKRFKNLEDDISILHLPWVIESINERIDKIRRYENILKGAGIGKLRYYLPEIFSDTEHKWQKLPNNSNRELSKLFSDK
jgi:hypothetical protein